MLYLFCYPTINELRSVRMSSVFLHISKQYSTKNNNLSYASKSTEDQQVFSSPVTKCWCSWVMHDTFLSLLLFGKAMLNKDINA